MAAFESDSFVGILQHLFLNNQFIMIVMVDDYPWDLPNVILEDGSKILKTAFPNRKRK
ncbi:MAG: hypothetical protein HQM13_05315 [SAR324 cluster bacterium]|nr:hypothetical protein [SAR324 cluster bacterium]